MQIRARFMNLRLGSGGGGAVGPCARWASGWRLQISLSVSRRMVKPVGCKADVRIYPDAREPDGGLATFKRFAQNSAVALAGKARGKLSRSLSATDEIYVLGFFPHCGFGR